MRTLLDVVVRMRSHSAKARPECFSLVDFGSDTVKAVVVRREKAGVRMLGYGIAPAEGYSLGGGRADMVALAAIADKALIAAEDQTEVNTHSKVVPDEAVFCIPASLVRGEFFTVRQARADASTPIAARELKSTWERLERLARERLPLLGDDSVTWKPLALAPGVISVDGHQVTDPVGLKGRELSLSAFGVAVWPSALRAAEAVAERLEVTLANVVAAPQALASTLPQREAILVDVGAQGTSLQLNQHDTLVSATWWPQGGGFFTQSLARTFRCPSQEAEALKRAYAEATLSTRDSDLVAQALAGPVARWLETLIARLRHALATQSTSLDSRRPGSLPGRIYLTGGGSLLPDLVQAIKSLETTPAISFRQSLEISWLGSRLGTKAPGRLALLDVPLRPTSDLLAPAISLATCLE